MYYILTLAIAAGLGLIPANIAKKKGYSFGLWWFYGWMLFIVAIIHVNLIPDKNKPQVSNVQNSSVSYSSSVTSTQSGADELRKFKELLDMGAITQDEYEGKKNQILNGK